MTNPKRRSLDDFEAERREREKAKAASSAEATPAPTRATKIHPIAALFHEMTTVEQQDQLTEDIKANGLLHPIVRDRDGAILDGLTRLRACEIVGVEPRFEVFKGDDPIAFIISANLKRRHLTESQRALIGAKLANIAHGGNRRSVQAENLPLESVKQATAAAMLNVSDRLIRHAGIVQTHGTPELIRDVEQGKVSVRAAAKQAKPPPPPKPRPRGREAINIFPIKAAFDLVQGAAARGDIQHLRQHLRKLLRAVEETLK
jgi:predicted lipid-binding transport protein (Tim44 family)